MEMDKLENKKITIIGSGHICHAFVEGLIRANKRFIQNIIVSNPSSSNLKTMENKYGVKTTTNNKEAVLKADWVIVAVKPLVVGSVLREIKDLTKEKLIISFAAAVNTKNLQKYLGNSRQRLTRVMPNLAVVSNEGVIGLYANKQVTFMEKEEMLKMFNALGKVIVLEKERDIDILTVVAGCGPAIVSFFMDMLTRSAISLGLSDDISQKLSLQIFKGTISYLEQTGLTFSELMQAVSTKGGITEMILNAMGENRLYETFVNCIAKGDKRIIELENILTSKEVSYDG